MAVVGYARVSMEDQSTEGQILDLQNFSCTEIFRANASGADRDAGHEGCRLPLARRPDRHDQPAGSFTLQTVTAERD